MKSHQDLVQRNMDRMAATGKLYRSATGGQTLWQLYLSNFKNNPVFRDPDSSEHNCNLCNNFIRRYGNIVAIENGKILTLWNPEGIEDSEYHPSFTAMHAALTEARIRDVFFESFGELNCLNYEKIKKGASKYQLGVAANHKEYSEEEAKKYGVVTAGQVYRFEHLHVQLPVAFVDLNNTSIDTIMAGYRDAKNVFQRAMQEIPLDTLNLVRDLIIQGSLLDGQTHLYKVEQFIPMKVLYDALPENERDLWCWAMSYKLPYAKFKNELIGVLCTELAEGKELNEACAAWNKRVDPANYMKATAPITKRQIEEAKKFVEENGYEQSFDRRFATIDDIKVGEIHHANAGNGKAPSVSIFDNVKSTSTRHKRSEFDGIETVSIEKFMQNILPTATSVEAFLTNSMEGNMVSLTTAKDKSSKPIFKWDNNFSWTFNGNLAGKSQIKEAVKARGGNVEGVLRFSLIWNDGDKTDNSDLDAWCQQPDNRQIGFSQGYRKDHGNSFSSCSGQLDLDNTSPNGKLAVENIYFTTLSKMKDGVYKFWVNQYSARNSQGFKAEIEFGDEIFTYEYNRAVASKASVQVAEVTLHNGEFTIVHKLPETTTSREIYGLESNHFHKVNLVCLSPNHWEGNNVGNKHYFFMLEGAKSPTSIRSFHNENLVPELAEHRKVLEVLGAQTMVTPNGKQLSGLGFNSSVREELVVKVSGTHKRTLKIQF